MNNREIKAAWHYHDGTKHPNGYLMNPWHSFDPMSQPTLFKRYSDVEPLPLSLDTSSSGVPALTAISTSFTPSTGTRVPDAGTLTRALYFSAGITKRRRYAWGDVEFRAAACTGALYHIELYVVCGDLPGLEAGVYHFDPKELALRRLRKGDHRHTLVEATGEEPSVANAPAIIVYSDIFWRNACKYQSREYRHAFWDSGTIIAHTLAIASAQGMPAKLVTGFVDEMVNRLLDLDTRREVALALLPVGHVPSVVGGPSLEVDRLSLKIEPVSEFEPDFPAIQEMHAASSLGDGEEVVSWRGAASDTSTQSPSGRLVELRPHTEDEMSPDPIEAVIIRRGSTRRFIRAPLTFQQLSTALERASHDIRSDFVSAPTAPINDMYLIVSAVDGLPSGAYVFHRDLGMLELLKEGDFRREAGHLGLDQELPADASVNVFFMSDLGPVLERFGNRGYRVAQLEASIAAGRLYLAAYAQRLGATGLTFYDDSVARFFSPHAKGKSAMFLVSLGKRARRR